MTTSMLPPQPLPDPDTAGFWNATADGEVRMCRCTSCRTWMHPPLERCRRCASEVAWEPISGAGTVHSFIVVRHQAVPGFDIPYVVALVELDDQAGLRLPTRLVGIDPDEAAIGLRVRAEVIDHPGGEYRVPVFRPEKENT